MTDSKLAKLKTKRTTLIGQQGRVKDFLQGLNENTSIQELETRLNALDKYYEGFSACQGSIEELDEEELDLKVRAEYEEEYFVLRPTILVQIAKRAQAKNNLNDSLGNNSVDSLSGIKLPKIVLPNFSGDYTKWTTFVEVFNTLVHNNKALDEVAKFHYLRSALSDCALRAIQSIEITSSNYEVALEILKNRYDNKKLIAQDHTRQIFSLPTIHKPSAQSLRALIDTVNVHIRALTALGRPALQWDDLLIPIILKRLDTLTVNKWEDDCPSDRLPALKELVQFLEKRCHNLEGKQEFKSGLTTGSHNNKHKYKIENPHRYTVSTTLQATGIPICAYCSREGHTIYKCTKFLNLSVNKRCSEVKRLNLCINCLRSNHKSELCMSRKCQLCGKKHNTLLHLNNHAGKEVSLKSTSKEDLKSGNFETPSTASLISHSSVNASVTVDNQLRSHVLLATALVQVPNKYGKLITCRALLDSGSQLHFVSERLAEELGMKRLKTHIPITGIGNFEVTSKFKINLTLKSSVSNFTTEIEAQILPKISGLQPDCYINVNKWPIPSNLQLADPAFYKPQKIDLLLGAELYCQLLSPEQILLSTDLPILQKTVLGWVVMGRAPQTHHKSFYCNLATKPSLTSLERQVQRFWEIERHDCPVRSHTVEEELCESFFNRTTRRSDNGQYCVRLPFRQDPEMLGNSQEMATRRFLQLERRLSRDIKLQDAYTQFLNEYEYLNHMEKISSDDIPISNYFLPHHCVHKIDSSTTKLRVVFDASAKSSSGSSLNHMLMVGPVVQPDLFSIVTRFRTYRFVFTADISKMYRQILIDPVDRKYQLIVWRNDSSKILETYQLNTVTYGTSSAPYLATRCLNKLANDEQKSYTQACKVIQNSFYVDDCMTGSDSLTQARKIQADLITVLKKGHFELRKFCANHPSLLQGIPEADREQFLQINDDNVVKTLGLIWQPEEDVFQFNIAPSNMNAANITKRVILLDLARIFDPLGFVGPVIVLGKILMQQLWKLKLSWDETLPLEYSTKWHSYREQLNDLNIIKIPRYFTPGNQASNLQLHGFADSSEAAYGACCYIRSSDSFGQITVRLICSKSRVASMKNTTLPRLELCGALLLAELVDRLLKDLQVHIHQIFYYTDSSIVLSWLKSPSYTWSTFIANRVARIQDLTKIDEWNHVSTTQNPADLLSRGVFAKGLYNSSLWFNGPEFLLLQESDWPDSSHILSENIPEKRTQRLCLLSSHSSEDLIESVKHSNSFLKLQRIFAYCFRFLNNLRLLKSSRVYGQLTSHELQDGLNGIIKNVQRISFPAEFKALRKQEEVDKSSKLRGLSPFFDTTGIIRVGGRLKNANIPYNAKHQIVLPKGHCVTKMLMSYLHVKHLHAAPQSLLNICRQTYWPIDGKNIARYTVHHCIRCFRSKPRGIDQLMGDLPGERVQPGRAFLTTGIDFCGPFNIHFKIRGKTPVKAYVAVFVCFTTKATHLELVSDLSSEAFIAALKRFISRRGLCSKIFCDNATNFVGSRSQLRELRKMFQSQHVQTIIHRLCQEDHIEWKPIPPRSPHFGGLWEAAVKAAKYHLVRVLANASLTYEELNTVIIQAEAVLNSRPLTPLSSDPNDLEPLTPGHFLIGTPLTAFPEPDITGENVGRLSRFRRVQQLQQLFWQRWSSEYLGQLQQRLKWTTNKPQIKVDSLVLLKEENLPPLKWMLGRVTNLFSGKDGVSRVAEVKTQFGLYRRAVVKLCPLPIEAAH